MGPKSAPSKRHTRKQEQPQRSARANPMQSTPASQLIIEESRNVHNLSAHAPARLLASVAHSTSVRGEHSSSTGSSEGSSSSTHTRYGSDVPPEFGADALRVPPVVRSFRRNYTDEQRTARAFCDHERLVQHTRNKSQPNDRSYNLRGNRSSEDLSEDCEQLEDRGLESSEPPIRLVDSMSMHNADDVSERRRTDLRRVWMCDSADDRRIGKRTFHEMESTELTADTGLHVEPASRPRAQGGSSTAVHSRHTKDVYERAMGGTIAQAFGSVSMSLALHAESREGTEDDIRERAKRRRKQQGKKRLSGKSTVCGRDDWPERSNKSFVEVIRATERPWSARKSETLYPTSAVRTQMAVLDHHDEDVYAGVVDRSVRVERDQPDEGPVPPADEPVPTEADNMSDMVSYEFVDWKQPPRQLMLPPMRLGRDNDSANVSGAVLDRRVEQGTPLGECVSDSLTEQPSEMVNYHFHPTEYFKQWESSVPFYLYCPPPSSYPYGEYMYHGALPVFAVPVRDQPVDEPEEPEPVWPERSASVAGDNSVPEIEGRDVSQNYARGRARLPSGGNDDEEEGLLQFVQSELKRLGEKKKMDIPRAHVSTLPFYINDTLSNAKKLDGMTDYESVVKGIKLDVSMTTSNAKKSELYTYLPEELKWKTEIGIPFQVDVFPSKHTVTNVETESEMSEVVTKLMDTFACFTMLVYYGGPRWNTSEIEELCGRNDADSHSSAQALLRRHPISMIVITGHDKGSGVGNDSYAFDAMSIGCDRLFKKIVPGGAKSLRALWESPKHSIAMLSSFGSLVAVEHLRLNALYYELRLIEKAYRMPAVKFIDMCMLYSICSQSNRMTRLSKKRRQDPSVSLRVSEQFRQLCSSTLVGIVSHFKSEKIKMYRTGKGAKPDPDGSVKMGHEVVDDRKFTCMISRFVTMSSTFQREMHSLDDAWGLRPLASCVASTIRVDSLMLSSLYLLCVLSLNSTAFTLSRHSDDLLSAVQAGAPKDSNERRRRVNRTETFIAPTVFHSSGWGLVYNWSVREGHRKYAVDWEDVSLQECMEAFPIPKNPSQILLHSTISGKSIVQPAVDGEEIADCPMNEAQHLPNGNASTSSGHVGGGMGCKPQGSPSSSLSTATERARTESEVGAI